MQPEKYRFQISAKVRFTQERLSILMPPDRRRLENRIGIVEGHWQGGRKPTVYFPEDGSRSDLRLLQVDPRHIELVVESATDIASQSQPADGAAGEEKLSQSELDDLFG